MIERNKIVDSWLVIQSQSGKRKELSLLVKRWHPRLCKHAFYYTKDMDSAKDIVQESWKVILNKLVNLKDPNKFGSWALSITSRKAMDYFRKEKKELSSLQQYRSEQPLEENLGAENSNAYPQVDLALLIQRLPLEQQLVITLFYLEEHSLAEISSILGIPVGTAKSRLFNARENLKQTLKSRNHEK